MTMNRILLRRVVSAVDLSARSVPTLKRALQLAYLHGGELFVVHVTNGALASSESEKQTVTKAFAALQRFSTAAAYRTVPVRWILLHGDPAVELARFIRLTNADLAVVGGALPRPSTGVVGTVAHAILRTTRSPVLVVPRTADGDASPTPYREILAGVASEFSTDTLRYALSLAQEFESRLTILNVEGLDQAHAGSNGSMSTDISRLRARIPHSAHDWTLIDERVARGEPARELVKMARKIQTDLVVVGSTAAPGREGGLGSVALGALTLTDASVLIVPASQVGREIEASAAA
jgi:nucleotide-binding universal stress UspA family protein